MKNYESYHDYIESSTRSYDPVDTMSIPKTAVVANCQFVNVRQEPNMTSEPIAILSKGSEVTDVTIANSEFYSVMTNGVHGYIKQEFLDIRS